MTPAAVQVTEAEVRALRASVMRRGGDLTHATDGTLREILAEVAVGDTAPHPSEVGRNGR